MSSLHVDPEAMTRGAAQIEVALEQADDVMQKMRKDVDAMFGAWTGPAADAQAKMHARFQDSASLIMTSLSGMHAALLHTRATYVHQEDAQESDHTTMANIINA